MGHPLGQSSSIGRRNCVEIASKLRWLGLATSVSGADFYTQSADCEILILVPLPSAAARLDRLPIGSFHRRILVLVGAGMFLENFDATLQGGVLGALTSSGWSNLNSNAAFISATFLGMFVGSFAAGVLGDRYGRRFSYQLNLLIIGITSLAAAFVPSMPWLIGLRLVMGLGLGAEIVIGYSTMSEFVPPQLRGRWIGYLAFITNTAVAASALVGYFAIPTIGWRAMFALAGAGALIVWHARKAMPESPRWLEAKGHLEEADRIITRIETEMGEALPELPPLRELRVSTAKPVSIGVLFTRSVVRRTLIGSLTTVTANVVLYGFLSWLPTFLVIQKLGVASSLRYTMLMSFGAPLGPLIGAFVADRAGRRVGLAASSILAAAVGGAYALAPTMTAATIAGFFLFLVTYLVATLGLVSYVPELFPTEYRLRGAGFCIAVGRMSAMLTPYGVVWAYTRGGVSLILALLGGLLLVQAIIVAVFGISTERRSLEDLSPEFRTVDHHDANPAQADRAMT